MLKHLVMLLALLVSCADTPTGRDVSPTEVMSMIRNDTMVMLVDVRTPDEYRGAHLPKSRLMNYYDAQFALMIKSLPHDIPVVLYCRSGRRSADAKRLLDSLGYTRVYNMTGGINAWQHLHFPVEQ